MYAYASKRDARSTQVDMTTEPVLAVERREFDGAAVVYATLHGATPLNVVDTDTMHAATTAFNDALARYEPRCVILAGRDKRAFIGGANLHALRELDQGSAETFIRSIHEFCRALRRAPAPVIAMMRGYCLGAGLEIAAACDIRIGDHSVQCGMPEVRVGVPSVIEAAILPLLVGWGKARELLLRGHIIDAAEAARIGLLQHLVDADELDSLSDIIARDVVAGAPSAIAAQKELCLKWEDSSLTQAIEHGVAALVDAYGGDEPKRYIDRFFKNRSRS